MAELHFHGPHGLLISIFILLSALQETACTAVCLCLMAQLTSTARALVDYRELCGGAGGQPSWGPSRGPSRGPGHFELPGVPGMALGTLGDRLCPGTPEKVDFSCLWGPCRSPLGDPAGTLFRLWTPPGPSWRAFGSDLLAVLVPPGFDPVFRTLKHRKNVVFRSAKSG